MTSHSDTNVNSDGPESLEKKIQLWVELDNNIKTANEEIKDVRTERAILNDEIIEMIAEKKLTNATVNISGGRLRFVTSKQTAPITLGYIETCLKELITNEAQVTQIMTFIKKKREVKTVTEVKRYYNDKGGGTVAGGNVDE